MSNKDHSDTTQATAAGSLGEDTGGRPYSSPRILSIEHLEAAATVCAEAPPAAPFGKQAGPFLCATLGS